MDKISVDLHLSVYFVHKHKTVHKFQTKFEAKYQKLINNKYLNINPQKPGFALSNCKMV